MNRAIKWYTRELIIFTILLFCCLFNYLIQQVWQPFLLPINIIFIVYFLLKKINIPILFIVICALLDEQLLGYHICSLVTLYSLICFIILNINKYKTFTFILSLILWGSINYNTAELIALIRF